MPLPRPPISANTPIPNQPFSADEAYYLEGNQGRLPLGNGLYIDPATGAFTDIEPSPYIYCVPQYGNLPVSYPPYGCETEVNTAGVTDFTEAWNDCDFTEMPCVDTSSGTLFGYAWSLNYSLTSFPTLNLSQGEDFGGTWSYTGLTSFPKLNFEKATNMGDWPNSYGTWQGCFDLESFPQIDTGNVITFNSTWYACYSLTEFPLIDVSKGEDFTYAWGNCTSLTSFPLLDVSQGTDFSCAWQNCTSLTTFPLLDMSSGLDFGGAWADCTGLTSFPHINVSQGVQFGDAWYNCSGLTSFPLLDVSNGEDFNGTWADCTGLVSFPNLNFSSGLDFNNTWYGCTGLASFPSINTGSGTVFNNCWYGCTSLTSFPAEMFDNCSATSFSNAWYDCALSQTSVDNILISLDTAGQNSGVVGIWAGTSSTPGVAGWAAVASLEAKGWTVSVNGTPPPLAPLAATDATSAEPEFPANPEPDQEFTDLATGRVYKWKRARLENGWFRADDPATPENEAWIWQWLPVPTNDTGEGQ